MQIHAVKTAPSLNIQAALASPEVRSIAASARRAGIELTGPIKIGRLDGLLSRSPLSIQERITIKCALDRAGLIERS
ncbi:hypothetical protein RZS28_00620 [Methylocapsa polymorpha]|uniref:Uncharacterized protein n=1 Tax=Methylocapsa polymorpha TaxID=3080828 RepID=A0ABZ0HT60_9HYPH|nr:hypothetical protein RZS28_00620 [Methylocapsa sp. RX1]